MEGCRAALILKNAPAAKACDVCIHFKQPKSANGSIGTGVVLGGHLSEAAKLFVGTGEGAGSALARPDHRERGSARMRDRGGHRYIERSTLCRVCASQDLLEHTLVGAAEVIIGKRLALDGFCDDHSIDGIG